MPPSSRTPEGEPLRCPICGAACNVDVSRPPGDSVCPCCGAHAWMAEARERTTDTEANIRAYVDILTGLCENNLSGDRVGEFLVLGMTRILDAYGTMLWVAKKRYWWSRRMILNLAASNGETDSPDFAGEVAAANESIVREVDMDGRETLRIGVPVWRDDTILGVIEILQHTVGGPEAQRGYVWFMSKMAEIIGGCESLVL